MSPGEVICEYKGKYTSLKVHPFEDASQQVSLEGTLLAEYSGRLAGKEIIKHGFTVHLADWVQITEAEGSYFNAEKIDA